jgi:hypothetical protein
MTVIELKSGHPEPWHVLQPALYYAAEPISQIRFDEEGHRYFLGNRELPSVTKILQGEEKKWYRKGSADRGHKVHRMVTLDAQGVLDEKALDPPLVPFLKAWRQFFADMVEAVHTFEEIVGDPVLGYAGRRDLTCTLKNPGIPGMVVYLKPNGLYQLEPISLYKMSGLVNEAYGRVVDFHKRRRVQIWK